MAVPRLLTAEDLATLPSDDETRYELVDGELVEMPPEFTDSMYFQTELGRIIGNFVRERRLGIVSTGAGGYRLSDRIVLSPDVGFIRSERIDADARTRSYVAGTPDLAVEVMSSSDRVSSALKKARRYLDHGTELVWVFDPLKRTVLVWPRGIEEPRILNEDDTLDGGDVLPGFSAKLSDLFAILDVLGG